MYFLIIILILIFYSLINISLLSPSFFVAHGWRDLREVNIRFLRERKINKINLQISNKSRIFA